MLKHIRLYLSVYVSLFCFTFLIGGISLSDWIKSFDPPNGIVINFQGQIIGQENIIKETRQGVKFWHDQLIKVRAQTKRPEALIAEQDTIRKLRSEIDQITNSVTKATEAEKLVAETEDLELAELSRRFALSRRLEQEAAQLLQAAERVREDEQWQWSYKESIKDRPKYIELEKIVTEKIITFKNQN